MEMKKFLPILFLVFTIGLIPMTVSAQQAPPPPAGAGPQVERGDAPPDSARERRRSRAMKRHEQMVEKHKEFKEKLAAMDQRLDQKLAAMNSATGDQKVTAMADVINEMVAQRRELMSYMKEHHMRMHKRGMRHHRGKPGTVKEKPAAMWQADEHPHKIDIAHSPFSTAANPQ